MSFVCKMWRPTTRRGQNSLAKHANDLLLRNLKEELNSIEFVSITVDLWTDRKMRSFIGVTAHFLTKSFELKYVVLACRNIVVAHTGENIKNELKKIIDGFNLE